MATFLTGMCYGCITFIIACQIHLEAYYAMPEGHCRRLALWMTLVRGPCATPEAIQPLHRQPLIVTMFRLQLFLRMTQYVL